MARASETEAAVPRDVPRFPLMRAIRPPMPNARPASPRCFQSWAGSAAFAARAAPRFEVRLFCLPRRASITFARLARHAGTNTENSTVAKVSPAAMASTHTGTVSAKPTSAAPKMEASDGPSAAKVTAQPRCR